MSAPHPPEPRDSLASGLPTPRAATQSSENTGSMLDSTRRDPYDDERARLREQAAAAFDVCHPGLALRAVLLVQLVLLAAGLASAASAAAWLNVQSVLACGGLAATLAWLAGLCALRRRLAPLADAARALVVVGFGAAVAAAVWWPLAWAGFVPEIRLLPVLGVLLGSALLAGLLWTWLDLRSRIWHPGHARARLAELQSRMRPHFLFNALNSAIALVRVDPQRAETVLEDLALIFQVALAEVGASVSLDEEVELAERYLAIEKVRFAERLDLRWQIDPRAGAARVPPLALQPLVENAVRHGIEPSARPGWVRVVTLRRAGQVEVTVSNSVGPVGGPAGEGMALQNLRERLRLLHDVGARLETWRDREGSEAMFHARIVLPSP